MKRPAPGYIDEITAVAEQWVRRCNGLPAEGKPVSRDRLRVVLASSVGVKAGKDGVIRWTATAGEFTAEPVRT